MAEMKNFNQPLLLMDLVVNENWGMDQLTHLRPFANGVSHTWKPAEQIDVIKQSRAKTGGGIVIVLSDIPHDPGQIV
jgi:hypothetical protein